MIAAANTKMPRFPTTITAGKYISLETFKKSSAGVRTPIWFAEASDGTLYAYSEENVGKVKRIRNNPHVRIAPCDMRGNVTGNFVDATAEIVTGHQARLAGDLLAKKYILKRFFDALSFVMRHKRVYLALR